MYSALLGNRHLSVQMARREILSRYRGSVLGLFWAFLTPLMMLAIYTFVFSYVFKARWTMNGEESMAQFAIVLFIGLIIHGFFAEIINRAPVLITSNVNFVKKIVFPLEILSVSALEAAVFTLAMNLLVFFIACYFIYDAIQMTAVWIPVVLLPLILFALGVSWILASMGVFLRDISQTTAIISTALLFLSPIFYPVSTLPDSFQTVIMANPLTFIIEQARNVLIWVQQPDLEGLTIYWLVSLFVLWLGFAWFQKTKKGFADVL